MQQAPAQTAQQPGTPVTPAPAAPIATPQTAAELRGYVLKRSELESQMRSLTNRRQELYSQRQRMGRLEGQGHDNRIALIDEQTTQIEREVLQLNAAIAQGTATVGAEEGGQLAGTLVPSDRQLSRDVRNAAEDAVIGTMFGSAAGLLAIYIVWRGIRRWVWKKKPVAAAMMPTIPDQSPRLEQLQQSVDVIALEVERISEAQRFLAKMLNERVQAIGAGEAQPVQTKNRDVAGERR